MVDFSHKPISRLPVLYTRPAVILRASPPLSSINLCYSVNRGNCVWTSCLDSLCDSRMAGDWTCDLSIASRISCLLHHHAAMRSGTVSLSKASTFFYFTYEILQWRGQQTNNSSVISFKCKTLPLYELLCHIPYMIIIAIWSSQKTAANHQWATDCWCSGKQPPTPPVAIGPAAIKTMH